MVVHRKDFGVCEVVDFKFEELVVYKKATNFADRIYSLTDNYPKDEVFGLAGQLRRAAVSISLNIAEGSARTKRDFSRFIDMARGSVYECVAILQISLSRNYISESAFGELKEYLAEISKMLSGLKYSLTKLPANTTSEPLTANTELRTMNYELRTGKAFTLLELVVAVALLALILSFSGVIFKVSITAQRTAAANAEIMQKFRAITDQLNADFKGLRKDAPLLIWFQLDPTDPNTGQRFDQIMFFADGDFQSTQLYAGRPVRGNVARIFYGQAAVNLVLPWGESDKKKRVLARRQHILTVDPALGIFPDITNPAAFVSTFTPQSNDAYEYDRVSLAHWKMISDNAGYNDQVISTCFNNRPMIDLQNSTNLHMLMSEGVGSFQIQWAYLYSPLPPMAPEYRWWPSIDPDRNGDISDSDFGPTVMNATAFGIYFNMAGPTTIPLWYKPDQTKNMYVAPFGQSFYPVALKFTFTLYDSRRIIEGGRRFTHIVYLE